MSDLIQIPVTVIGGYLGSGKTTLVNHLLRNSGGKRLAILVNEFGELSIDADLIEAQDDNVISLTGGCVCCSYGSDLIKAMMDMAKMDPRPDHVILEASGVALPGAIVNSLSLLRDYSIDGVVVLADAETVRSRANDKYMSDTILRQLSDADIVLLNKVDLVSAEDLVCTNAWLKKVAAGSAIVETTRSNVPPDVVLRDFEISAQQVVGHHNTSHFSTHWLEQDGCVDPAAFAQDLIDQTPGLVRAKGFVRDLENQLQTLQIVGKRYEISSAPDTGTEGIVVIAVG